MEVLVAKEKQKLYGLLAKFETQEELIAATKRVSDAGYRQFDTYSPYPIEELSQAMNLKPSPLPYIILAGDFLGVVGGFAMQAFATVMDYPLNIGGRPAFSWPTYIPITFELTILLAATFGVLGLFALTRFPQPYHPVFNSGIFNEHGSQDGFYLDIQVSDPKFKLDETRRFLSELGSSLVSEIEA